MAQADLTTYSQIRQVNPTASPLWDGSELPLHLNQFRPGWRRRRTIRPADQELLEGFVEWLEEAPRRGIRHIPDVVVTIVARG